MTDGRCRFGPRAKREMVARLLAGEKARAIARSLGCSPTTVTTTRDRWLEASRAERASGAWCAPRRPVPKSCPWALGAEQEQAVLEAREKTNWGPMQLTALTGRHRSTNSKVLRRHVNGHRFLPSGGHRFSPLADMISPRWWPSALPGALSTRS